MEPNQTPPQATVPNDPEQQVGQLLEMVVAQKASDLHLTVGVKPTLRLDGTLHALDEQPVLTPERVEGMVNAIVNEAQKERLEKERELDFSLPFEDKARFRVNIFHQRGYKGAAFRLIPTALKSYKDLNLPEQIAGFAKMKSGLVLFAGPTGHGKSTTQAAIIDDINTNRGEHIVTIEDPIEYTHYHKKSIVDQREVHQDTNSFANALRAVLREDPDVVLIGEMRDPETMASALTIAETGHLVFATIHTNDAAQTIDRVIDTFPDFQQNQIRAQLSQVLSGVVSQRLLPQIGGGRIPAVEIMVATSAIRNLIREAKTHQIPGTIQTSSEDGMVSMEKALAERIEQGLVKYEDARMYASDDKTLNKLVNGGEGAV